VKISSFSIQNHLVSSLWQERLALQAKTFQIPSIQVWRLYSSLKLILIRSNSMTPMEEMFSFLRDFYRINPLISQVFGILINMEIQELHFLSKLVQQDLPYAKEI
jgi:hypothetical protein